MHQSTVKIVIKAPQKKDSKQTLIWQKSYL